MGHDTVGLEQNQPENKFVNAFKAGAKGNYMFYLLYKTYKMETFKDRRFNETSTLDEQMKRGVRRPYRGISIKKETFATMSVVKHHSESTLSSTANVKNSSVRDDSVSFTSNFLVNSVSESRNEKHQPVSTFGKDYVYFFGEQPRQMTFNITLLNTDNFRWEEEWWANYEDHFRGTRLAAREELLRIRIDESVVYGYMINCSSNKDSQNPHTIAVTFTLHVTKIVSVRVKEQIGSHKVIHGNNKEYGYLDFNLVDTTTLDPIVIGKNSQRVREYNTQKYLSEFEFGEGAIGAVARFLNDVSGAIQGTVNAFTQGKRDFLDFLYGRNIVIPVDAADAEFASGNPQFAEGTRAFAALQTRINEADKTSFVVGRQVTKASAPARYRRKGDIPDNYDEYPYKYVDAEIKSYQTTKTLDQIAAADKESRAKKVAEFLGKSYGVNPKKFLADENGVYNEETVPKFSNTMRALGAASFLATNIGYAESSRNMRRLASDTSTPGSTILTFPHEISFTPNVYYESLEPFEGSVTVGSTDPLTTYGDGSSLEIIDV